MPVVRSGDTSGCCEIWAWRRRQVIEYGEVQFTKAPHMLAGIGFGGLKKTEKAVEELRRKGLAPE